ncbi:hypothetical protein BHK98_04660 [Hornefia porci]|uniref:UPF0122 protein BHK98_04660 n=1 Tax=Hornefia porci TaxID=2652292 RepID=A0A1Q9JLA7_9FIRM|nr:YlxM family DNA-binding protein [Hornefia porci]OLR56934.1 hypothetical protein BHK98_04660 [Hornefia porci]
MNEIAKESLLFDFYGNLLTEKKRRVMELYHEEDLSLAEIAENFGISRAAVHDSLKSAERQLADYERKLGMVAHMTALRSTCEQALGIVAELAEDCGRDPLARKRLTELRKLLGELERA